MMNNTNNKELLLDLYNEEASKGFANQLAICMKAPLLMGFSGDIGAGKTTIIRAMLKALGVTSAIKSPTFSLVESYQINDLAIHHFDLYRIAHEDELDYIGFRDYFSDKSICLIEWPEHAKKALPIMDMSYKLSTKGAGREMQVQALTATGEAILSCLAGEL